MSKIRLGSVCLFILFFTATASAADRQLQAAEKMLKTDGPITMQFHSALYYPDEISLQHDGFIVGIEKSPMDLISDDTDRRMKPVDGAGLNSKEQSEKFLHDQKVMFVSHVLSRADGRTCDLYNAYRALAPTASHEFNHLCPVPAASISTARQAYRGSWNALDTLRDALTSALKTGSYDDIVVITMGWNTPQDEAIRNINTLTRNLVMAMSESGKYTYRPLVIGVTWPSQWTSSWLDPAVRVISFPTKAEDADQVGLTWLGALLHETIPDAQQKAGSKLNVIGIGHSFGSRALSTAACVGPAIYNTDLQRERQHISVIINLQGAFKINRVFSSSKTPLNYPHSCGNVDKYVMTSSKFDKANEYSKWGAYMGEASSYKKICDESAGNPALDCLITDSTGGNIISEKRLVYVNADALMFENAYMTGGGAHSDIYRREHGQFIANIIRSANRVRVLKSAPSVQTAPSSVATSG